MNDDPIDNKRLLAMLNKQAKQIEQLREKVFTLQEALVRGNPVSCGWEHPLAPITPMVKRVFPDTRNTVIAFSGVATRLGMPPTEFLQTFANKKINTIYIKDFKQCWYQQGLLGMSADIGETVGLIKRQIPEQQKNIYAIGTSAGGFAAILFGILLDVDKIIAFGPQTFLSQKVFHKFKGVDSRYREINFDDESLDLKKLLGSSGYTGPIHIHFSVNNEEDKAAAESLAHFKNVHLYPWEAETHNIAGWLKNQSKLDSILDGLITMA